jgi:hypothetical protein
MHAFLEGMIPIHTLQKGSGRHDTPKLPDILGLVLKSRIRTNKQGLGEILKPQV